MPRKNVIPIDYKGPDSRKLRASGSVSVQLTADQQQKVKQQLYADITAFPMESMRQKYLLLDLAYYMENSDQYRNTEAARIMTTLYKELELPVLQPNIDAAWAYLVGVFLSGHPIFGVVNENPEQMQAVQAMEAIVEENARMTGWARQLSLWIKSALKYNTACAEVDWKVDKTFRTTTNTEVDVFQGVPEAILRAGNEIKNWDMYNTFFDTTVYPADVHSEGDFSGRFQRMTLTQVWSLVKKLQLQGGTVMNITEEFWKSQPHANMYHTPKIISDHTIHSGTDWFKFFDVSPSPLRGQSEGLFEVVTYFRRMIPSMMGIKNVPDADNVQIWKFVEINGYIVYAERRTNAHNLLPTVFVQPYEDNVGHQAKGLGENLLNAQNLSGTMYRARLASLARAISDRGLFDPSRINSKDINSVVPSAKIPVKPSAYGARLQDAYYQIPYDDRNGQLITQEIGQVHGYAERIASINKVQRGEFIRGNRTLGEYQETMDNAWATQQASAIIIENQAMIPIKHMVKTNILQYQTAQTLTNPSTQQTVDVDPVQLRQALIEFKIADGLLPKDRLLNTQAGLEFFQVAASIPGANQEYDLLGMFEQITETRGFKVDKYKRQQMMNFNQEGAAGGQSGARSSGQQGGQPAGGGQETPQQ